MSNQIAGVEIEVTDLKALCSALQVSDSDKKDILKEAELLVPKDIRYVIDENERLDIIKTVAAFANKEKHLLIEWPKGTGKTTAIYYVAQETNNPVAPIQFTGSTGVDTIIGRWLIGEHGTFWQDGLFTRAWRNGWWIVLDELNMALPEVTAVLHPCLDGREVLVLDEKNGEVVPKHPNTRIFAAINPSEDYAGTKEMNLALVDRFTGKLIVDYPNEKKELKIVKSHKSVKIDDWKGLYADKGMLTRMIKVANDCRKLTAANKLGFEFSTRNVIDWAVLSEILPIKDAFNLAVKNKADKESYEALMKVVNLHFRDDETWVPESEREVKVEKSVKEEISVDEIKAEDFAI